MLHASCLQVEHRNRRPQPFQLFCESGRLGCELPPKHHGVQIGSNHDSADADEQLQNHDWLGPSVDRWQI